jgi:hypothetical protein
MANGVAAEPFGLETEGSVSVRVSDIGVCRGHAYDSRMSIREANGVYLPRGKQRGSRAARSV